MSCPVATPLFYCLRLDELTSIGSPFRGDKLSVHAEAVQDRGSGHGIEDFSPVRRDEIRRHQGRRRLCSLGDDLKDPIGLFLGGDHIPKFVEAEDWMDL